MDRAKLDLDDVFCAALELATPAVARLWIGAETPVRGEGQGVLREGLVRFLASLFIDKQFGAEATAAERERQRLSYSAIAKRDAPLSRTTMLDRRRKRRFPSGWTTRPPPPPGRSRIRPAGSPCC